MDKVVIFKQSKNDIIDQVKNKTYSTKIYSNIPIEVQLLFQDLITEKNNGSFAPSIVYYNDEIYRIEVMLLEKKYSKLFNYINENLKKDISNKCLNIYNDFLTSLKLVKEQTILFKYAMKLDLKAAFYKLDIQKIINELDFHDTIKNFLKKIYLNNKYFLKNDLEEEIIINFKELFLGLPSSEYIFSYFISEVNKNLNLKNFYIYVDDYIIFSNTKDELELIKKNLSNILKDYGLELNEKKTKIFENNDSIMFLNRFIRLNTSNDEDVDKFKKMIKVNRKFSSIFLDYKSCENIEGFKEFYQKEMTEYCVFIK